MPSLYWLSATCSLERALAGCQALFHVAADYRLWVPDPEAIYRTNVAATGILMRAALAALSRSVRCL